MENSQWILPSRVRIALALALLVFGLFQIASTLLQESPTWSLLYGVGGMVMAIGGLAFLQAEMQSDIR